MKTDIEYAARVMGDGVEWEVPKTLSELRPYLRGQSGEFDPLHDDGDSRRLEAACMKWLRQHENTENVDDTFGPLVKAMVDARCEDDRQADRDAVFALAVAIGKVIDGGGV